MQRAPRWESAVFVVASAALVSGAVAAAHTSAAGEGALAWLSGPAEWAIGAGARVVDAFESGPRVAALMVFAAGLALALWRARGGALQLLAALGLGWVAQAFLLDGAAAPGAVVFAIACTGWLAFRPPPRALGDGIRAPLEIPATLVLLALLLASALFRVDVYPDLYFDEVAYLRAARMQLGQLAQGSILEVDGLPVYSLEQFRSQALPLGLQTLALRLAEPGLLSLRLLSAVLTAAAVLVSARAVRRAISARAALFMLAFCAGAPLLLLYTRTGLYMSASLLHGALCFWALLRVEERFDATSAALLGGLLGASLYFYQLSWFAPLLVLAALASAPALRRRPGAGRMAVVAGGAFACVVLPGVLVHGGGIRAVTGQTFDRAVWNRPGAEQPDRALVALPDEDASQAEGWAASRRERGLEARVAAGSPPRALVLLEGSRERVNEAARDADAAGWAVLRDPFLSYGAATRLARITAQLFAGPAPDSAARWIDASLLNPLLAPLLLLGVIEAWRRCACLPLRWLAVWVVAGAVLPAVVGGAVPRRALLALPFAWALAALPLLAVGEALADRGRAGAVTGWILGALLLAAVWSSNALLYFERWDQRVDVHAHAEGPLAFARAIAAVPSDERILLPDLYRSHQLAFLSPQELGRAAPVVEREDATSPARARVISCGQVTPFTWVTLDAPEGRALLRGLSRDFLVREEVRGAFALHRVGLRKRGACKDIRAPR